MAKAAAKPKARGKAPKTLALEKAETIQETLTLATLMARGLENCVKIREGEERSATEVWQVYKVVATLPEPIAAGLHRD